MTTSETSPTVPLALVGIGCLFPRADQTGHYWANIKHGVDCIGDVPPTHWDPKDYFDPDPKAPDMTYAQRGGFLNVVDFNPLEFGIAPRDLEATDTTQLLGLVAAKRALNDAQVDFQKIDRSKVSVILGVTGTLELVIPLGARLGHPRWRRAMKDAGIPDDLAQDAAERIAESYVPWQENSFPGLLGNVVAGRIANRLDLHGTNCVVDAACASSLSAVHLASLELATGKADVVVTGGADTFNDIFMFMCFSKTPALSKTGNSRPFDAQGDGTILGEGIGVVVLKRLADAERDGDRIYAVLRGIGTSSDGKGNAIYAPSAEGQKRCLVDAYSRAGVPIETVELIEAHGTGTRVGDATEATALTEVFGAGTPGRCVLGSVKSQIGHTKAAAGAASLIKVALSLYNKVLPPTLKVTQPVEPLAGETSPFSLNQQMRPWLPRAEHPRRAGMSAFGFGGSNFHAVLEEYSPTKATPDWDGLVDLVPLQGPTIADLKEQIQALRSTLNAVPETKRWAEWLRAADQSRATFSSQADCRLVLVAHRDITRLATLLEGAERALERNPQARHWRTADGAFFGQGTPPGGLAVLFPGQGAQSVGMLRQLTCLFPEMLNSLAEADEVFAETHEGLPYRLSDAIYPPTSFQAHAAQEAEDRLRATDLAQPAIGAISLGAWRVLSERFGLRPSAFCGHSFGELTALHAAGVYEARPFLELACLRGSLMAQSRSGQPSSMLAVFAPAPEVAEALTALGLDLVVANKNSPKQTVISGASSEIERAVELLASRGLRTTKLSVAAGFHSHFVSDAAGPLTEALKAIPLNVPQVPVIANTTAQPYPAEPDAMADLLGHQLARPVEFVESIRTLLRQGTRVFVEIGPGSVLGRLTESILAEEPDAGAIAISLESSAAKKPATWDLACLLGRLASLGFAVNLPAWEQGSLCRPAPKPAMPQMTVPVCGANSVLPRPARPPRPTLSLSSSESRAPVAPVAGSRTMHDPQSDRLNQAIQLTQQTLAALQRMQEDTAQLHRQFLERQEQAQQALYSLIAQQQSLMFPGQALQTAPPTQAVAPAPGSIAPAPMPQAPSRAAEPPEPVIKAESLLPRPQSPRPTPDLGTQRIAMPSPRTLPPAPRIVPSAPVPVSAAPATPSPLAAPANAQGTSAHIEQTLLAVVAEKTGYPVDMLNLDMTLDNDLGVDSIKRVEILSTLQDKLPNAPVVKPEHLGTLHSLRDVAQFLSLGNSSDSVAPRASFPSPAQAFAIPEPAPTLATPVTIESTFPSASNQSNGVAETLLEVVAEKTGYPVDMLTLDMTLDNDLGVDSIKRVEILSTLQDKLPNAPVVKPEQLGTLHSLRDVALFLSGSSQAGKAGGPGSQSSIPASATQRSTTQSSISPPSTQVIDIPEGFTIPVSDLAPKTEQVSAIRMPDIPDSLLKPIPKASPDADVGQTTAGTRTGVSGLENVDRSILQAVDLDLTLTRPRLKLTPGSTVLLVASEGPFTTLLCDQLAQAQLVPQRVDWSTPPAELPEQVAGLILAAPPKPAGSLPLNRLAFLWLKAVGSRLRDAARSGSAFAVSLVHLDGTFGIMDLAPSAEPSLGGLAGLIKTARFEWPELAYKALDLAPAFLAQDPAQAAAAVVEEALTVGPLEVGISAGHRISPELVRTVRKISPAQLILGPKDVVLVTGGARGVTAEVAFALAEAFRASIAIIGRTPLPNVPEPSWIAGLTDEAGMKKAIADQLGPQATPRTVQETFQKFQAQREIRQTLQRIEQTGAKVAYYPADVLDGRAVANALQQILVKLGTITVVVHGAGVLADKKIEDLTVEQFDSVYNTKVVGLKNILDLIGGQPLKSLILFSSTTARFGRAGQAAYAVANEVLNKTAQVEARRRPNTRVVAINWGPWEGGMVTPGLKKLFESEGVGLISLAEGASFALQELNSSGQSAEVIALGRLRPSSKQGSSTFPAASINLPVTAPSIANSSALPSPINPGLPEYTLVFERSLDLTTHPVLRSHVIDGRAVLPMVLHMEWLAHAALHGNPGLLFHGFNEMRVTNGIMVEESATTHVRALAARATKVDKTFIVPVELRGKRRDGKDVVHSRAEVVLTAALPKAPIAAAAPEVQPYPHPLEEIYHYFLFHGPDLHAIERVTGFSETAFIGSGYPSPSPNDWLQEPLRGQWVADPLILDASFQMMILWSYAQHGSGSLPCFAGRYRQYRRTFPTNPVVIQIRITRDNGSFARSDIDYIDATDGGVIATLQDYECVIDPQLNQAFRRNQLVSKQKQQS